MNNSYESFARDIVTVSQRDSVIEDLRELINCLYKTSTPLRKHIETMFMPQQASWLMSTIKQPLNIERLHTTESMLTNLINYLLEIKVCTITVATTQTFMQIQDIQDWIINTTKAHCLIDLKIDYSLIAGATIQFGGKFTDNSLKLTLTYDEIVRYIS